MSELPAADNSIKQNEGHGNLQKCCTEQERTQEKICPQTAVDPLAGLYEERHSNGGGDFKDLFKKKKNKGWQAHALRCCSHELGIKQAVMLFPSLCQLLSPGEGLLVGVCTSRVKVQSRPLCTKLIHLTHLITDKTSERGVEQSCRITVGLSPVMGSL